MEISNKHVVPLLRASTAPRSPMTFLSSIVSSERALTGNRSVVGNPKSSRMPLSLRGFVGDCAFGADQICRMPQCGDWGRSGLRFIFAENINDFDGAKARDGVYEFLDDRREAGLQQSVDLIEKWHNKADGRITCFMAAHAPENCSPTLLRGVRELAEQYDIGYTVHLSQSSIEIEAVMNTFR